MALTQERNKGDQLTILQAFIVGVATTSLVFYVYDYIAGYFDYLKFKKWLVEVDVDIRSLSELDFDKYFAMWEISKLPNIVIEEVKDRSNDDGISGENGSK